MRNINRYRFTFAAFSWLLLAACQPNQPDIVPLTINEEQEEQSAEPLPQPVVEVDDALVTLEPEDEMVEADDEPLPEPQAAATAVATESAAAAVAPPAEPASSDVDKSAEIFVEIVSPRPQDQAVLGNALLIIGEAKNPIEGQITARVTDCGGERLAELPVDIGGGKFFAYVILPAVSPATEACLNVTTGSLDSPDPRVSRTGEIRLSVVSADADAANVVQVGAPERLFFRPGASVYVYGVAPNAAVVTGQLQVTQEDGTAVVAGSAEFAVDDFGFWQGNLDVSPESPIGTAILVVSAGEGDTYREARYGVSLTE